MTGGLNDTGDNRSGFGDAALRRLERLAVAARRRRLLPASIADYLMYASGLRGWQTLDDQHNRDGKLPDDEEMSVEAIWIAECYPPSRQDALLAGLERLRLGGHWLREPLLDQVQDLRSRARGGGGVNLGYFTRRGEHLIGPDYVETEFPAEVKHASAWLDTVSPSLTVIGMQFELTDEARLVLDRPLRAEYRTRLRRRGGRWTYLDPDNARRESMIATLDNVVGRCTAWLDQRIPGSFAAGLMGGDRPACIFMTTRSVAPLARPADHVKWMWLAGIDNGRDSWELADWPSLRLRVPTSYGDKFRQRQWWLAGRQKDLASKGVAEKLEIYGGATIHGWLNRMDQEMKHLVITHATQSYLEGMHRRVAMARDTMGYRASNKWNSARLEALREEVLAFVRDIEPVATELADDQWRPHNLPEFLPGPDNFWTWAHDQDVARLEKLRQGSKNKTRQTGGEDALEVDAVDPIRSLGWILARGVRQRARLLLEAGRQQREAMTTVSTLVAAAEATRLDRRLLWLTVALIVLAVVGSWEGLEAVWQLLIGALR